MSGDDEPQAFSTRPYAPKRAAKAEQFAHSVLYLASDDKSFATSTVPLVDGGTSITQT
ncbi:hypothetical protein [Caballeronia fortuita]|uniref:hypothetical protein n=1 Tax=Caballeronia fortuita TaxID=1777138 RepID=UPI001FC96234|nr:hypothetical protein [Caballeronia fortuita]